MGLASGCSRCSAARGGGRSDTIDSGATQTPRMATRGLPDVCGFRAEGPGAGDGAAVPERGARGLYPPRRARLGSGDLRRGIGEGEDGIAEDAGDLGVTALTLPGGNGGAQDGGFLLFAGCVGEVGGEDEEGELAVRDVQEPADVVG